MQNIVSFEFTGTAKEFVNAKIRLNGAELDQITVGNLAKHGILYTVGEGDKPARGRTPKKYKAVSRSGLTFSNL